MSESKKRYRLGYNHNSIEDTQSQNQSGFFYATACDRLNEYYERVTKAEAALVKLAIKMSDMNITPPTA